MTAPLLAAEFGTLSLLTIPANLLAAPLVPAATIAGVLVVASGPIAPLAAGAGWVAWFLSAFVLWLASALSVLPYFYYEFAPLSGPSKAALYALLLIVVVLILPEGRLMIRGLTNWMRREPAGATLSAIAGCVALVTATFAV
jgi:competence protein ComEC